MSLLDLKSSSTVTGIKEHQQVLPDERQKWIQQLNSKHLNISEVLADLRSQLMVMSQQVDPHSNLNNQIFALQSLLSDQWAELQVATRQTIECQPPGQMHGESSSSCMDPSHHQASSFPNIW